MEFNYLDLVVVAIVLILGLKGFFNGFFKELFGLIGIIGGIFVASRVGDSVGEFLSDIALKLESSAAISFVGFIATLALFWLAMIGAGYMFKKLSILSGLGILDRIFGFVLGSGKFFLIAAVIAYAINNIEIVRNNIKEPLKNSFTFPILIQTGSYIMKLDTADVASELNVSKMKQLDSVIDVNNTGSKE